jgi:hypothetical protein
MAHRKAASYADVGVVGIDVGATKTPFLAFLDIYVFGEMDLDRMGLIFKNINIYEFTEGWLSLNIYGNHASISLVCRQSSSFCHHYANKSRPSLDCSLRISLIVPLLFSIPSLGGMQQLARACSAQYAEVFDLNDHKASPRWFGS